MRRNQNIVEYNPKQVRKLRRAEAQGTIGAGQQAKLNKTREARANRPNQAQVQQDMVQKGPEAAPAMAQPAMPGTKPYTPGGMGGIQNAMLTRPAPEGWTPGGRQPMPGFFGGTLPQMYDPNQIDPGRYPFQGQGGPSLYEQSMVNSGQAPQFGGVNFGGGFGGGMPAQAMPQQSPWGMPQNVSAFGQGFGQGGQQPQAIRRPLMSAGGGQSSGY